MFKAAKNGKNAYACNYLIKNAMLKRRRLAYAAILNICETKALLKVVK